MLLPLLALKLNVIQSPTEIILELFCMSEKIVLYGSPTCAMVPPVRGVLERAGAEFEYIDIFRDGNGRLHVREINNGNESVPTLVFTDGSTLTEPSLTQLKVKLAGLGYYGRSPTWLEVAQENLLMVLMSVGMLIFGIVDGGNWIFLALGGAILVGVLLNGKLRG
jgi:mycoredoxin